MCKLLRGQIYNAIENSEALFADFEIELLAGEVYEAIKPLVELVTLVRENQRLYFASKSKESLKIAIDSEIQLDDYLGLLKKPEQLNLLKPQAKS